MNTHPALAVTDDDTVGLFKGYPWADVKAFGAVGDGVTDDAAAIQAAIYAQSPVTGGGPGGIVFLPPTPMGYLIGSSITFTYGVILTGAGNGGQGGVGGSYIKLKAGSNCSMFVPGGTYPNGSGFVNLTLDGNKAGQSAGAWHGIGGGLDAGLLQNVRILNCKGDGFHGTGGYLTEMNRVHVSGCDGWGMNFDHQNDSKFRNIWMSANITGNLYVLRSAQMKFTQLQLEGGTGPVTTGPNMQIDWSSGIIVSDSNFAGAIDGMHIWDGCNNIIISGCFFGNNNGGTTATGDNLQINANGSTVESVTIEGCTFDSRDTTVYNHINVIDPGGPNGHCDRIAIHGNTFPPRTFANKVIAVVKPPLPGRTLTDFQIRNNPGFKTENSGTATIDATSTSVVVNHGLDVTPALQDISVTPTLMSTSAKFWISTATPTQFTIHTDVVPGPGTATFVWRAAVL